MRKTSKSVALLAAMLMLAAACSKPKSDTTGSAVGSTKAPDVAAPVSAGDTSSTTAPGTAIPTTPGAPGANVQAAGGASSGDQTIARSADDEAQARAVGARIQPQTTVKRNSHPGVTDNTIKLVFSLDKTSCGVNVVNAITAAGGALPTTTRYYRAAPTTAQGGEAEAEESIKLMVQYFNDHAFDIADYLPNIRKLMGDDPKNQWFGRHLTVEIVDGGSNQCPEKTTAAAKQAIEDKAFAVFNNYDGAQYNMAAALNAQPAGSRPMHFGTLWLSDQDYSRFAPYSWTQFATGTTIARQYASYVCSRVATGEVPARSAMVTDPKKRTFALVHTNVEQDVRLANELKGYLNDMCGLKPKEITYEGTDFGKAQQDNANVIVQLKVANITSVLMLTDPVQPLFQLTTAKQQNYFPEWIWSSFGYEDSSTVQRLYDQDEVKGSFGTSNLGVPGGFGFGAGDPFRVYHEYHKVAPDGKPCDPSSDAGMNHDEQYCKAPGWLVTGFYTLLPATGGLLFAGPDPTPQSVSTGLQHFPSTRYGGSGPTTDPRPALVGAGDGKYGFVVDAAEWRWRPDFTSPKPEAKLGWVEYPDCQRHYIQWPNDLAPNWEKDGANYNAWCGDKNGYPRVLPEDSNG
jgi:hypothetical protein